MKNLVFLVVIGLVSCAKQQVHPPVGGVLSQKDLHVSRNRSKSLNELERQQIQDWIKQQQEKFYPMGLNYWVNKENLSQKPKRADGERVSYRYEIYDFDKVKLYEKPKVARDVYFGKFEEIKAVDDALRYLSPGEEVTLLVPSVLAFGTYGDNDKIPNDMPLIIKLKAID